MPVGSLISRRLVRENPIDSNAGISSVLSFAKCDLCGSIGYGLTKNASSRFSHAFLYGVNTEKNLPAPVSTSSFSKMT